MDVFDLQATLRLDTSSYDNSLAGAQEAAENFGDGLGKPTQGMDNMTNGMTAMNVAAGNLISGGLSKLVNIISDGIGGAVSRADTLNNYSVVMQNLGYSANDAETAINTLKDGIDGLPTTLDGIASVQQQFAALGGPLDDATELTLALNNATLAGGQGQEKANSAMQQWYQMIAAGKPDLMSMRIINEAMPAQMDAIAKATVGADANWQDLNSAWQDGKVTTEQVKDAIIDLNENGLGDMASFTEQAATATGGLRTSFDNMRLKVVKGITNIIEAIGRENIVAVIQGIGNTIETFGLIVQTPIDLLGKLFGWLTSITGTGDQVTTVISGIATAVTAFGTALIVLTAAQKAVAMAQALMNAVMMMNPIFLIISGIVALIAVFVLLWKKFEGFRNFWINAWNAIKGVAIEVWNALKGAFEAGAKAIKAAFSGVKNFFANMWNGIKSVFKNVASWFGNIFSKAWKNIKSKFSGWASFWSGLWGKVKSKFSSVGKAIGGAISGAVKAGINGVISLIEARINGVIDLINGAIGWINKIPKVNIPKAKHLHFPRLAEGGIVTGETIATVGEAGDEAVVPLDKFWDKLDNITTGGNTVQITNYITVEGAEDPENFASSLVRRMKIDMRAV